VQVAAALEAQRVREIVAAVASRGRYRDVAPDL